MICRALVSILSLVLTILCCSTVLAADPVSPPPDSARTIDTLNAQEKVRPDSTAGLTADSLRPAFIPPAPPVAAPKLPRFSPFDTLANYFTSARLNQREVLARSYLNDAGDYFKFDPGFVAMDYLSVPMRKTVKPYGLTGDHLGILSNDVPLKPFDHPIEPDGLIDFDDVPTETDIDVYLLPGVLGTVFGSRHDVATLLARPMRPSPREAHSAFLVDKGADGFSYARSRYSRAFSNGRAIDIGLGYRLNNYYFENTDNSYFYDGDFLLPVGERTAVRAAGHLYKRNGLLLIPSPDSVSLTLRDRFDRTVRVLVERYGADGRSITSFGYRHDRQGSNLGRDISGALYKGRFGITDHGVTASRQWLAGGAVIGLNMSALRDEYENGWGNISRYAGDASFTYARYAKTSQFAIVAGARSAERFGAMPNASAIWKREAENSLWLFTVGYSEREPSLHELYLPERRAVVYSGTTPQYEELGNPGLERERQLVGSLRAELGKIGNSAALTVVGGKFWNGIEWRQRFDTAFNTYAFAPVNEDYAFVTTSLTQDISLGQFLRLHGGGSYHYIDYASGRPKVYQPDYQAFGGAELHIYWKQKLIHLYAYGEAVYLGPYDGYRETGLGQTVIFNAKYSFSMGSFRFHLVQKNLLNTDYESREFGVMRGRSMYWGFVWNFLD